MIKLELPFDIGQEVFLLQKNNRYGYETGKYCIEKLKVEDYTDLFFDSIYNEIHYNIRLSDGYIYSCGFVGREIFATIIEAKKYAKLFKANIEVIE